MVYIVHVVKHYAPGAKLIDQQGEWVLETWSDLTLADVRCKQLNNAITLSEHHWYELRENVSGLQRSELYRSGVYPLSK